MRDIEHHLFYCGNIAADTGVISLDKTETNHAVSVLRAKVGDPIRITGGDGIIYDCQCMDISKQSMSCRILDKTVTPRLSPELSLFIGLPDKEHFETILEYTTALGAARIVPLIMDHCRKPWWESWEKLRERFATKMIVSMKQCLYPYMPRLDTPVSLDEVINTCDKPVIVADQYGKKLSDVDLSPHKKLTCLVGPPGGMSARELILLEDHDMVTINIAAARLRTELAAAVLCARIMNTT